MHQSTFHYSKQRKSGKTHLLNNKKIELAKLFLSQNTYIHKTFIAVFLVLVTLFSACTSEQSVHHNSTQPKSFTPTITASTLNQGWKTLWTLPTMDSSSYLEKAFLKPSMAWSPAAPQTLYLCRVLLDYSTPAPANALTVFYRSDDLGQHWLALPLPEPAANCAIKTDPTAKDTIVLLDNRNGKYVSHDRGQHWSLIPTPPGWEKAPIEDMNIQPIGNRLYVGGYWTSDLHTWIAWSPSPAYSENLQLVAVNPQQQNILYTSLSTCSGAPTDQIAKFREKLCRSDDGGKTWHYLHTLALSRDTYAPKFCLASDNPSILYASGVSAGSMRSNDEGHTWTPLPRLLGGIFGDAPFEVCSSPLSREDVSTRVDIQIPNQDRQYQFAITNNGVMYHATQQAETLQGATIPAGVTAWNNNQWERIAPPPLQIDSDVELNTSVLWFITKSGHSILLAFDRDHLYYYAS